MDNRNLLHRELPLNINMRRQFDNRYIKLKNFCRSCKIDFWADVLLNSLLVHQVANVFENSLIHMCRSAINEELVPTTLSLTLVDRFVFLGSISQNPGSLNQAGNNKLNDRFHSRATFKTIGWRFLIWNSSLLAFILHSIRSNSSLFFMLAMK